MVETLDDVVEAVADALGVYGAHKEGEQKTCRVCYTSYFKKRILQAVEVGKKLDTGPCGHSWDRDLHQACPRCAIEECERRIKIARSALVGILRTDQIEIAQSRARYAMEQLDPDWLG